MCKRSLLLCCELLSITHCVATALQLFSVLPDLSNLLPCEVWTSFAIFLAHPCSVAADAQFTHWYPFYRRELTHHSTAPCYSNYSRLSFPEYSNTYGISASPTRLGRVTACKFMASCLLSNIEEIDKADMASASIILGLAPTILGYLGPTITETAILSSQRPILTVLCSLGAPAIFPKRSFEYDNPADCLETGVGLFAMRPVQKRYQMFLLSAVQYLVASLAVVNVLLNTTTLGTHTILSWKCSWSYNELAWAFITLIPHVTAAVSMRLSTVRDNCCSRNTLC